MPGNRFQILSTEALIDLLNEVTRQLLVAIECKASDEEIIAKRKELERIQEIILQRKPQPQIQE